MAHGAIEIIRVYHDPVRRRGECRVLVDRLWPRGLAKDTVDFDEWAKDLAPSGELRQWYGHDPELFQEFSRRYRAELKGAAAQSALARLFEAAEHRPLVLLTATHDVGHSGAAVLRRVLQRSRH